MGMLIGASVVSLAEIIVFYIGLFIKTLKLMLSKVNCQVDRAVTFQK